MASQVETLSYDKPCEVKYVVSPQNHPLNPMTQKWNRKSKRAEIQTPDAPRQIHKGFEFWIYSIFLLSSFRISSFKLVEHSPWKHCSTWRLRWIPEMPSHLVCSLQKKTLNKFHGPKPNKISIFFRRISDMCYSKTYQFLKPPDVKICRKWLK